MSKKSETPPHDIDGYNGLKAFAKNRVTPSFLLMLAHLAKLSKTCALSSLITSFFRNKTFFSLTYLKDLVIGFEVNF